MDDPRAFNQFELDPYEVDIYLLYPPMLQCRACGETWTPQRLSGGRLEAGYWFCPHGCNAHDHANERPRTELSR